MLRERGRLGFNAKLLIEMGEEVGSAGLRELCEQHKDGLLQADLLIASDGPRIAPDRPTLFLGARGGHMIDLVVDLREGGHHSGNWGGLLANPGIILAHALACITDARGTIAVPEWRPPLPQSVRRVLQGVEVDGGEDGPAIDHDWGEPDLTSAERVFGWNSFEVLAFITGTPERPVNAIPGHARAHCQLRYVVGTDTDDIIPALRRHLDRHGFRQVEVRRGEGGFFPGQPARPGRPVGDLGDAIHRAHHRSRADHPAESGRIVTERYFRRCAGAEDHLGPAFLRGMFAARAQRAPAGAHRPRRAGPDGGTVLGPGRAGHAAARPIDYRDCPCPVVVGSGVAGCVIGGIRTSPLVIDLSLMATCCGFLPIVANTKATTNMTTKKPASQSIGLLSSSS